MRYLRHLPALAAVCIAASTLVPSVSACECTTESARHAFRRASAVFTATVVSYEELPDRGRTETDEGICVRRVRVRIERLFKGSLDGEVTITQCSEFGCYPFNLAVGESYLIYAFGKALRVKTSACTRTSPLPATKDADLAKELANLSSRAWRFKARIWPW